MICAACDKEFQNAWSDEEAAEEARANFGQDVMHRTDLVVICDTCYVALMREKTN